MAFKSTSIRNKIIYSFTIILVSGFLVNFVMNRNRIKSEAIEAIITEAEQLTLSLEKVREGMGDMFSGGFYDMEAMI